MDIKKKKIIGVISSIVVLTALIIGPTCANQNAQSKSNNKEVQSEFSDVKEADWFSDDVDFVKANNYMQGTSDTEFSPHGKTTRGMIVTVLWRIDGENNDEGTVFSDIKPSDYFYNAVLWASKNNIVSGYSADVFAPNDNATREQFVTILYRYAKYKGYDISSSSSLNAFADISNVSEYARDALMWAVENKIITGTSDTTISPKDYIERCQLAAILHRFCDLYLDEKTDIKTNSENESESTEAKTKSGGISSSRTSGKNESSEEPSEIVSNTPMIYFDDVDAVAGEEVEVRVKLKNNPGILGMTLSSYFDDDLKLISTENGEAFKDILTLTPSNNLKNGSNFVWDGVEIKSENIKDGDILILKFKISDNASEGKHQIAFKCFDGDVVDNNLQGIPLQIQNGSINVKNK